MVDGKLKFICVPSFITEQVIREEKQMLSDVDE